MVSARQPLWSQIVEEMAHEITIKHLAPGSQLPPEAALMERFGVSRFTLRRAMSELAAQGLIRIEQGRGTFVHDTALHYRISQHTSFSRNLRDQGKEPHQEELECAVIEAPEAVRQALKLNHGASVIRHVTLSFADDIALAYADSYYPAALFPDFLHHWRHRRSTTQVYAAHGFETYRRHSTRVAARMPNAHEARLLRQPEARPVLVTHKLDVFADALRLSYGETLWSSDRVEFVFDEPPV